MSATKFAVTKEDKFEVISGQHEQASQLAEWIHFGEGK